MNRLEVGRLERANLPDWHQEGGPQKNRPAVGLGIPLLATAGLDFGLLSWLIAGLTEIGHTGKRRFNLMRNLLALLFVAFSTQVSAGIITLSYTEKVLQWDGQLRAVGSANNLNDAQLNDAKKTAAGWVVVGPCQTPNVDLNSSPAGYAIQVMADPNLRNPIHAAVLQMVAIMTSDNLGRKPTPDMCRFASDLASAH